MELRHPYPLLFFNSESINMFQGHSVTIALKKKKTSFLLSIFYETAYIIMINKNFHNP